MEVRHPAPRWVLVNTSSSISLRLRGPLPVQGWLQTTPPSLNLLLPGSSGRIVILCADIILLVPGHLSLNPSS